MTTTDSIKTNMSEMRARIRKTKLPRLSSQDCPFSINRWGEAR